MPQVHSENQSEKKGERPKSLNLDEKYLDSNDFHQNKFYLKPESPAEQVGHRGSKNLTKYDKLFVQMNVLGGDEEEDMVWQETSRWIKYEQNIEEGADRWGKAHVSSLSFHSLISLRRLLAEGLVIFDLDEPDYPTIMSQIVHQMILSNLIQEDQQEFVMKTLLLKHRHVNDPSEKSWKFYQPRKSVAFSSSPAGSYQSRRSIVFESGFYQPPRRSIVSDIFHTTIDLRKPSMVSMKSMKDNYGQIPTDGEATLVLIGNHENLDSPGTVFVRLADSVSMPNITEVPIPVKFIFILLGPTRIDLDYKEIGRSIATLMSNMEFHNLAHEAGHRTEILKGIHDYLNESIVLPPSPYQEKDLLSLDDLRLKNEALKLRKQRMSICMGSTGSPSDLSGGGDKFETNKLLGSTTPGGSDESDLSDNKGLTRTGQFFGGFVNDIRRRFPIYWSDVRDGLNFQCLAAIIFMSFAQISGTIAFGGLMDAKTGKRIGIPETLLASSIGGIFIALLGGQPLLIAASTGPIMLFDAGLFSFCEDQQIDFLVMRTWVGVWLSLIALIFVAFEASFLIGLFSRFALEIFAVVISFLFIAESLINLFNIYKSHPLMAVYGICEIDPYNDTIARLTPGSSLSYQPNTALLCTILMFGTFAIAHALNNMFRNSDLLTKGIRTTVGNFAVPISIAVTVLIDYSLKDTFTKKLDTPAGLEPTYPRSWFINPVDVTLPIAALSSVPALLLFILLFMEVSIAESREAVAREAVHLDVSQGVPTKLPPEFQLNVPAIMIVAKDEYKTVKGSGFHLDILLICVVNTGACFFGLSWISVALVRTVTHCSSVTVFSTNNPPGEKPVILGLKEQRVTNLFLSILTGASVTMASVLGIMPTAVIFGVFLFMGVGGLNGIQFIDRISLFFKQVQTHPQVPYVRRVRTSKMHLYTGIQFCWFVLLWGVNYSHIALSFALFVILMIPFRYFVLPRIFRPEELAVLDASGDDKKNVDNTTPTIILSSTEVNRMSKG